MLSLMPCLEAGAKGENDDQGTGRDRCKKSWRRQRGWGLVYSGEAGGWVNGLSPKKRQRALLDLGTVRRFSFLMISFYFLSKSVMNMVLQVSGSDENGEVVALETGRVN